MRAADVVKETSEPAQSLAAHICRHHPDEAERPACACQRLFWPRRIHALTGALLGCFLLVHFALCITGLQPSSYQKNVDRIGALLAHLPGLVLITIFLPLAAQAATGLFLLKKEGMKYNVKKCNRGGKLRFFSQRISALVILGFVVMHVGILHPWGFHLVYRLTHAPFLARYAEGGLFHAHQAAFTSTALALRQAWSPYGAATAGNWAMMFFSLIGVWAAAFHAGNGAWTGGIIWKITDNSTKSRWSCFCLALGIVLMLTGTLAWGMLLLSVHMLGLYLHWHTCSKTVSGRDLHGSTEQPGPVATEARTIGLTACVHGRHQPPDDLCDGIGQLCPEYRSCAQTGRHAGGQSRRHLQPGKGSRAVA